MYADGRQKAGRACGFISCITTNDCAQHALLLALCNWPFCHTLIRESRGVQNSSPHCSVSSTAASLPVESLPLQSALACMIVAVLCDLTDSSLAGLLISFSPEFPRPCVRCGAGLSPAGISGTSLSANTMKGHIDGICNLCLCHTSQASATCMKMPHLEGGL